MRNCQHRLPCTSPRLGKLLHALLAAGSNLLFWLQISQIVMRAHKTYLQAALALGWLGSGQGGGSAGLQLPNSAWSESPGRRGGWSLNTTKLTFGVISNGDSNESMTYLVSILQPPRRVHPDCQRSKFDWVRESSNIGVLPFPIFWLTPRLAWPSLSCSLGSANNHGWDNETMRMEMWGSNTLVPLLICAGLLLLIFPCFGRARSSYLPLHTFFGLALFIRSNFLQTHMLQISFLLFCRLENYFSPTQHDLFCFAWGWTWERSKVCHLSIKMTFSATAWAL